MCVKLVRVISSGQWSLRSYLYSVEMSLKRLYDLMQVAGDVFLVNLTVISFSKTFHSSLLRFFLD